MSATFAHHFCLSAHQADALANGPARWAHVWVNRITDKANHTRGFMTRRGANWELTLELPSDILVSYSFSAGTGAPPTGFNPWQVARDRILAGPAAPDSHPFDAAVPQATQRREIEGRRIDLFLPSGATTLLTVFDGADWFDRANLPGALVAAGLSSAVVGITPRDRADRQATLGWHPEFIRHVQDKVLPLAGGFTRHLVAGQSLGGVAALLAVQPGFIWDAALAQSPSLWWSPNNQTTPQLWAKQPEDWVASQLASNTPAWTQAGSLEGLMPHRVRALGLPYREYTGGHDLAWWRVGLLEFLSEVCGRGEGGIGTLG